MGYTNVYNYKISFHITNKWITYRSASNFGAHFYYGNTNSNSDCNLCNTQVDSQYGLQCGMCDRWLHPECVNVNNYELESFEQLGIPFMCPQCEQSENDLNDPVLDPPASAGLAFAHLNVNGLDVEGRIDDRRLIFKHKFFDIISINETKLTTVHITSSFNIDGYELLRADRKRVGNKTGGGHALYIRDNVTLHEKTELILPDMEGICGFVNFPNKY